MFTYVMVALPIKTVTLPSYCKDKFGRVFLLPMLTGRNVIEM